MLNMESDMANEPYLKLMQKDKPPTSRTYAIVENNAAIYRTYATVERNAADVGLKKAAAATNVRMKAMKAKTPWDSLHTSANRSLTPALNLDATPEQHARIMRNTSLAKGLNKAATVHHEGSWKKAAKQPLQGDQEDHADSIAQRAAGMQRVQGHLREE